MLVSSSPGVLDGDEYNLKIEIAENCSLTLQTQSYQRLYTMKKGASQHLEVCMQKNVSFCYLPHPTVPHEASDFVAKNKIFLSSGCTLFWSEILTCGRKLSGEVFKFSRYHNLTEIFLNNRLVIKENLLLKPSSTDITAIGQLEGYTHQASFIYINEIAPVNNLITALHELLKTVADICFGISALPVNGLIVRLLAYKGEQLYNLQKQIAEFITNFNTDKPATIKPVAHAS